MERFSEVSAAALIDLVDGCSDGAGLIDPESRQVVFANVTLSRLLTETAHASPAASLSDLSPIFTSQEVLGKLSQIGADKCAEVVFQGALVSNTDPTRTAEFRFRQVRQSDDNLLALVVRMESVSGAAASPQRTDPLTGLADRTFVLERLETLLRGDRAADQCCAVLFVDVDGFKQVNDALGHRTGDHVLCEVATRLAKSVRWNDHVARFGGDEFVIVLESVCGCDETQPVVERIRGAFDAPFTTPERDVRLSVSIGVAEASPGCGTADDLIDAADRAMYAMKRAAVRGGA